jgi:hypothetical protein
MACQDLSAKRLALARAVACLRSRFEHACPHDPNDQQADNAFTLAKTTVTSSTENIVDMLVLFSRSIMA